MLRVSASVNGETIDLRGVGNAAIPIGLPHGDVLSALAESAVLRDTDEMDAARQRGLDRIGPAATLRAIAVAANFEMMNRLLDAVGVGPPRSQHAIGDEIGVELPRRFT